MFYRHSLFVICYLYGNLCEQNRQNGREMLDTRFTSFLLILFSIAFYVTFTTFCCVTFIISYVLLLLCTQLFVCEVIAVFHFRFLNRTYQRICRISTECINRVINDRRTIVYLCFLHVQCGNGEKYVGNYSV